jgi:beta-lactamase regulating signal transducer with metallopeptidase domain
MLWWFIQNTLVATLLAAAVSLTCRVRRLSPAVRHALWLVVLIKLVTPQLVVWPWSLPIPLEWPGTQSAPSTATAEPEAAGMLKPLTPTPLPSLRGERGRDDACVPSNGNQALQEFVRRIEAIDQGNSWLTEILVPLFDPDEAWDVDTAEWSEVDRARDAWISREAKTAWLADAVQVAGSLALRLWLAGTMLSVLVHGGQVARFLRMLVWSQAAPASLIQRVKQIAATMRVRPPTVSVVSQLRSPVIWGGLRTRLVWPASLEADFESGRWDGVIAHELAHLRRGDHWIGWLELLAGCVYWWNPLFWYVRYQLRENAELACDAVVVWALPDGRRRYAASLIEVVSHFSHVTAPLPVLGVHSVARQAFERRLTMILSERVPSKLSAGALTAITLIALAALPCWSQAQVPAAPRNQPASTAVPAAPVFATTSESPLDAVQVPVTPFQTREPIVLPPVQGGDATVAAPGLGQSAADDSRIDTLEKKLQALVDEVKAMRSNRNVQARVGSLSGQMVLKHAVPAPLTTDVQTLSRATYRLPQGKAEAMAAFLREHMKSPVEAKVEGDNLIVTTTPQAQSVIGQFVALSEGLDAPVGSLQQMPTTSKPNPQNVYFRGQSAKQATPASTSEPAKAAAPATTTSPKRQ